jgi:hypothetical protein
MSLQIIGAGFGRTGTLSMKYALEQLGVGPCYHMLEVLRNPDHDPLWLAALHGEQVRWEDVFGHFQATVDWPAAFFWRELAGAYPEARVLLSVRDAERWYTSMSNTIYKALTGPPRAGRTHSDEHRQMTRELILERTFNERFTDKAHAIAVFNRHNEQVRDTVPAKRLLVYETGSGWEPLCNFLGCDVPKEDFPRVNSTDEFNAPKAWDPTKAKP